MGINVGRFNFPRIKIQLTEADYPTVPLRNEYLPRTKQLGIQISVYTATPRAQLSLSVSVLGEPPDGCCMHTTESLNVCLSGLPDYHESSPFLVKTLYGS